jgi:hypothetical protein
LKKSKIKIQNSREDPNPKFKSGHQDDSDHLGVLMVKSWNKVVTHVSHRGHRGHGENPEIRSRNPDKSDSSVPSVSSVANKTLIGFEF